jgi:alpha-galactosidase
MKKVALPFIVLSFLCFAAFAQSGSPVILKTDRPKGWIIQTKSSTYQLVVATNGSVKPGYYGAREQAGYANKNAAWYEGIDEVPVRGGLPLKTPALEVVYADHVRDAELVYVSSEILDIDGRQTLKITQKDKVYPLQVTSYIRVLPEYDILEKWITIKNTGKKDAIKVENLQSGSIVLPADEYVLTQLSGGPMHEFQLFNGLLTPGLKVIQNKTFKSPFNAPWFQVRPQSSSKDKKGPAWFGCIHYSGNWSLAFDKAYNGNLQVLGGINFWDTALDLKPGMEFQTPKLSVGYTPDGSEGASMDMGAYVRNEILPVAHRHEMRPVLFNSWYATTDKLKVDEQVDLAKSVSQLGAELFVIDAGWYVTNVGWWGGIGTWEVDKKKFPNGLSPLINAVHDDGMKFGIWFEPENIHLSSDVYKKHPDWILKFADRDTVAVKRTALNLAKEEVYQHLLASISKMLSENKIDFVKWDQNNYLRNPGWPDAPVEIQREVRIRFINNLYRLVDELRKRFPKVLFESCASGGGRVDLGTMSRMDQAWTSDNTVALDRLFIQYGYLSAMPANTMVSWVIQTTQPGGISKSNALSFKFDVAMTGVLGVGLDIRKLTPEERVIAKDKIALYKQIRPMVQQGILHRLVSPFENNRCALQYNAANGKSSVLFCFNMAQYLAGSQYIDRGTNILKLEGLNPDRQYRITKTNDANDKGTVYKGDFLMNIGIVWPVKNAFDSQISLIDQID